MWSFAAQYTSLYRHIGVKLNIFAPDISAYTFTHTTIQLGKDKK